MNHARQIWPRGRRIAILNWRDLGHPQSGGAELYCFAVARWLARHGASVTVVTARAPGQPRRSVEDGVHIHRGGGRFGVYVHAFLWLLARRRIRLLRRPARIDAVLDCQNGIPFFAPLAVGRRTPVVLLIHHVHQQQFALHFSKRVAGVGRFLEGPASRRIYRGRPVIAVSPSTRTEIRKQLRYRNPLYVVANGGPRAMSTPRVRSVAPSVVTVGRLVVQKQVDQLLTAVAEARRVHPGLELHVIGDGEERENLQRQIHELELDGAVHLHGRVSDGQRDAILGQSWIFLSASQREGWGVAVLEAAAHDVPALVSDVPGLRDAVRSGTTGWLVGAGASYGGALVDALNELEREQEKQVMARQCQAWAQNFSWIRCARRVSEILEHEYTRVCLDQPVRQTMDLVTRVEIAVAPGSEQRVGSLLRSGRLTDEWRWMPGRVVGLLYGTDEHGAQRAMTRLGIGAKATITVARSHDLLGEVPALPRPSSAAVSTGSAVEIAVELAEMQQLDPVELADAFEAEILEAEVLGELLDVVPPDSGGSEDSHATEVSVKSAADPPADESAKPLADRPAEPGARRAPLSAS